MFIYLNQIEKKFQNSKNFKLRFKFKSKGLKFKI